MRGRMAGAGLAVMMAAVSGLGWAASAQAESRPSAVVTRDGDRWTASLALDRDAPVWVFAHSAQMQDGQPQWRPAQWRVETPGVVIDRLGAYDVLRTIDGVALPRMVRLTLSPASARVAASYDPALVFSDGSVALFSGQFDVFPVANAEAARGLPDDLNGHDLGAEATRVTWRDMAGPVLFQGQRLSEATASDADTYVLFGQAALEEHPDLITVVDPAIPSWIRETMIDYAPQVTAYYAKRLGGGPGARPMVMASWKGPTPGMTSMGGSVLPGLIVASFEGEGVVAPSGELTTMARWFIGHESAHFWLGQTVRYEAAADMWITEGGADLMAVRALAALDPRYDARSDLQREVDDCAVLTRGRSVTSSASRGEHRAFYACGAVFALTAEGVQARATGGDWFDFLKALIDASREDGVLTREEWLSHLTTVSGDAGLRAAMEALLDEGAADPPTNIASLFDRSGVAYRLDDGRIVLEQGSTPDVVHMEGAAARAGD